MSAARMGIDSRQQVRGQRALLLLDASPALALGLQPPSSGSISTLAVSLKPSVRLSAMLLLLLELPPTPSGQRDPPLNRSPTLTVGELITAYSSPCPPPLPFPQHTWPHPTLLGNAPPTPETKFGLRKKKKRRRRRRKLSQAYLYTVCSCAPSFIYRRKSGKSLEEEKKNSSQWVEPMKTYLLPGLLEACPCANLGVCVFRK